MKKKTSLYSVGSMLDGILARHGIAKQVMASRVVSRGNEILHTLLPPQMLGDIKVLSYQNGILTLACRHAAAVYDGGGLGEALSRSLEAEFPALTIKAEARLRPDAFLDPENL